MTTSLEKLTIEVNQKLKESGLRLATAESCTGGGISYWLTSIPGSSTIFDRGFVTYSNDAKIEQLGVSSFTLENHGAVSEQTVIEMAEGALRNSNADISLAITGIAGPEGGTPSKQVGTVWFALASCNQSSLAFLEVFSGDRQQVREQAIERAFRALLGYLR